MEENDQCALNRMLYFQVSLKSLWLSDAMKAETQLESIFYEPFSIEHKKLVSHDGYGLL